MEWVSISKCFFATRSGNKVDTLPIKQIVDYFDWSKSSRYPEVIKSAFEDIKAAGLIAGYKLNNIRGKFSKGYIEVEKSSKWIQDFSKSLQDYAKSIQDFSKWIQDFTKSLQENDQYLEWFQYHFLVKA